MSNFTLRQSGTKMVTFQVKLHMDIGEIAQQFVGWNYLEDDVLQIAKDASKDTIMTTAKLQVEWQGREKAEYQIGDNGLTEIHARVTEIFTQKFDL